MPNQRAKGVSPRTVAIPDVLWEKAVAEGPSGSAVVKVALEEHFELGVSRNQRLIQHAQADVDQARTNQEDSNA